MTPDSALLAEPSAPILDPVPVLAALAHPARLAVFQLLMQRHPHTLSAGSIGETLTLRPSTLSGYLTQLAEAGLIHATRSGTTLNYAACPSQARALTGAWLGPITGGKAWPQPHDPAGSVMNVLFVGQHNDGISLAAEAILRRLHGNRFEVFSAGITASTQSDHAPDPALIAGLERRQITTADLYCKPVAAFQTPDAPRLDIVIALETPDMPLVHRLPARHQAVWRLPADLSLDALIDPLILRINDAFDPSAFGTTAFSMQSALDAQSMAQSTA